MVKNIKILLLVGLVLLSQTYAFAFEAATVDCRTLLILHPQMADFDYSCGRFFRDGLHTEKPERVYEILRTAASKADEANKECNEQIALLRQKIFELQNAVYRCKQGFAPGDFIKFQKQKKEYAAALNELEKKQADTATEANMITARKNDLKKKIQNLENALKFKDFKPKKAEIERLTKQIAQLEESIAIYTDKKRQNEEEALKAVYLTTEETNARIEAVKSEVKQIIKDVASQRKVSFVVDNSFAIQSLRAAQRHSNTPISDGAPDIMSAQLFQSFSNYETDEERAKHLPMPAGVDAAQHMLLGRASGLVNNLRLYLEYRGYMPQKAAAFQSVGIFLSGSEDLTIACAEKIFSKYKTPDLLKQYYINLLTEYLKLEE